jgi:hypothetical protein
LQLNCLTSGAYEVRLFFVYLTFDFIHGVAGINAVGGITRSRNRLFSPFVVIKLGSLNQQFLEQTELSVIKIAPLPKQEKGYGNKLLLRYLSGVSQSLDLRALT